MHVGQLSYFIRFRHWFIYYFIVIILLLLLYIFPHLPFPKKTQNGKDSLNCVLRKKFNLKSLGYLVFDE